MIQGTTVVPCPSIFAVVPSTGELKVSTSDINHAGVYTIRITASHSITGNYVQGYTYSIVTILNPCSMTSINSSPLTQFHYDINEGNKLIANLAWTKDTGNCPLSITYTLIDTLTYNEADPTVFSIASNSIYVNTNVPSKARIYNLKVRAKL